MPCIVETSHSCRMDGWLAGWLSDLFPAATSCLPPLRAVWTSETASDSLSWATHCTAGCCISGCCCRAQDLTTCSTKVPYHLLLRRLVHVHTVHTPASAGFSSPLPNHQAAAISLPDPSLPLSHSPPPSSPRNLNPPTLRKPSYHHTENALPALPALLFPMPKARAMSSPLKKQPDVVADRVLRRAELGKVSLSPASLPLRESHR